MIVRHRTLKPLRWLAALSALTIVGCGEVQSGNPPAGANAGTGGATAGTDGAGTAGAGASAAGAGGAPSGASNGGSAGVGAEAGSIDAGAGGAAGAGEGGAAGSGGGPVDSRCSSAIKYSGNVSFADQSEFDDLPLLAEIEGDLKISAEVTDLAPLSCLESVHGTLTITNTLALVDLKGLERLREVFDTITIIDNSKLTTFAGLEGLTRIGSLFIDFNPLLRSLSGLDNVEDVRALRARKNNSLTSLDGLQALKSAGMLLIWENPTLADLSALSGVRQVERLDVAGNSLRSLAGLEHAAVSGNLHIAETKLETLEALTSVNSLASLTINDCRRLKSLEGLRNLQQVSGLLWLVDNPAIGTLQGLRNLTYANAVHITRMKVPDLTGLEQLEIGDGGELRVEECAALVSLNGLSPEPISLGTLTVNACPKLTNLEGLETIQDVSFVLEISNNSRLAKLSGLEHLKGASRFSIVDNSVLESLAALESLSEIRGSFAVTGNPKLPQCQAVALRTTAASQLEDESVTITGNDETATCP
jgi:hypothetical protein